MAVPTLLRLPHQPGQSEGSQGSKLAGVILGGLDRVKQSQETTLFHGIPRPQICHKLGSGSAVLRVTQDAREVQTNPLRVNGSWDEVKYTTVQITGHPIAQVELHCLTLLAAIIHLPTPLQWRVSTARWKACQAETCAEARLQ
jgi:hypothetical protein